MLLNKHSLAALKEDDFSRQVLVPLFAAMGYRDVRFHGGGILEQGKDLTMWAEHDVRTRTNYAVVVKATPITGEAATAGVITQLRQAFAYPFRDLTTGEEHRVHECFVVTSHDMKKEAIFTLRNVIDAEPFGRYVTTMDADRVWQLMTEHLGPQMTLGAILENYRRLTERTKYAVDMALGSDKTLLTVRSKEGLPIEVPMLQFTDTPEGQSNRGAYEAFVKTGVPAILDLSAVTGLANTGVFADLGIDPSKGSLRVSQAKKPSLVGELHCRAKGGKTVTIPGLELVATGGTETLTISNSTQDIPLHFTFEVHFDSAADGGVSSAFRLDANFRGSSIHWYVLYLRFAEVASKQCVASFKDVRTGIEHTLGVLTWKDAPLPAPAHIQLAEQVLRIQSATRQVITIPDREFFTAEDVENIFFVETAVTKGSLNVESIDAELSSTKEEALGWRKRVTEPVRNVRIASPDVSRLVLDTNVALGPMEVVCTRGRITTANTKVAVAALARGELVKVTIKPIDGGRITATFPMWRRPRR